VTTSEPGREAAPKNFEDWLDALCEAGAYIRDSLADRDRLAGELKRHRNIAEILVEHGRFRAAIVSAYSYLETRGTAADRHIADHLRAALTDSKVGENARKVEAYDAARATVKIEGNTRAYYVLRAEHAEAQAETYRAALDEVGPFMEEAMSRLPWGSLQGTWQNRARTWHAKHNATLRRAALSDSKEDN